MITTYPGVGQPGDIRIVEFKRSAANPDLANPDSARLVLKRPHSAGNHNGGWMAFGPDGKLYFTIGDNAFQTNAQDLDNLFGKVMRIDPADPDGLGPETRTIPSDNPFASVSFPGGEDEIYTLGLRNPYRASFAPNGNLVIGDVGAGQTEEVDVGNLSGKNMGWPDCEGSCDTPNALYTEPFFTYEHSGTPSPETGNVIIGGYVIRDPDLAGLTGRYIYGDNQRTDLRTLNLSVLGGDPVDPGLSVDNQSLLSFGEDSRGCTYVMAGGTVSRIAANAAASAECPHAVDVPDPPDPPVDSTKPSLALDISGQRLGKKISFSATCSENCAISAKGALKAKRRGKKKAVGFKYTTASRDAAANKKVKVVLKLKPKALKNARRVLRNGRKLNAVLVAAAADPSGNKRSVRFTVKVRHTAPKR
ncbi:MAG: PQQ-dependent sugar dehydrogenase [Thermoleophilia bacterium]|nr:PQQ-dependent sugar dehydrogenase [Thermoleophilia bacterium]